VSVVITPPATIAILCSDWLLVGRFGVRVPNREERFPKNGPEWLWDRHILLLNLYRDYVTGIKWPTREVNKPPSSNEKLGITGALPPLPSYTLMMWIGTAL
jgi:hypothetical protein